MTFQKVSPAEWTSSVSADQALWNWGYTLYGQASLHFLTFPYISSPGHIEFHHQQVMCGDQKYMAIMAIYFIYPSPRLMIREP